MKKLFIASGLLALMAAATSCDKYDIYDDQYGDVMLIKDGGDVDMDVYSTDDYADRYISVIKGGHSPERVSHANLRVMTNDDFNKYVEDNIGENFSGLGIVDADLFDLIDANGNVTKSIEYTFSGENDRYFGATLRVKSSEYCKWYRSPEVQAQLANKEFIIPIGLYSETDSVNEYNNVLMVSLNDLDPVITCDVPDGGFDIEELSRRRLINDAGKGLVYEPEVYLTLPCKNPWGFGVRIVEPKAAAVPEYADEKKSTPLTYLKNDKESTDKETGVVTPAVTRWEITDRREFEVYKSDALTGTEEAYTVNFPAGVTKARIPLKIYLDNIDPNEMLNKNLVVPIVIENKTAKSRTNAIAWDDNENKPSWDVVKTLITATTFQVGVKVIEAPIDLDDSCVTSNDCEPSEGSINGLFDDDLSTFFHSGWTVAFDRSAPYGSYLEITLPEEIDAVYFNITARSTNPCSPKKIDLYYSNEIDNENSWVKFATATNTKKLASGQSFEIGKIDKMYQAPETFKYLRFCVIENDKGENLCSSSKTIYWNLAELKLYGKNSKL
ncbi:MAG: hypothetical protein HDS64_03555 [Bacteroidales bacterium]|nr:hypothetical protein [Bacteroidales bacterium]MBD5343306.1 hypothetical protein [Bacteroides sp.]MBD5352857.1 hypothetical protein [Bacteroides sp.]MBD5363052.1 hypothetical protein [Bacteroides sp.]MBD5373327.1 hypothetical protein [Bacteroides sp.]